MAVYVIYYMHYITCQWKKYAYLQKILLSPRPLPSFARGSHGLSDRGMDLPVLLLAGEFASKGFRSRVRGEAFPRRKLKE